MLDCHEDLTADRLFIKLGFQNRTVVTEYLTFIEICFFAIVSSEGVGLFGYG